MVRNEKGKLKIIDAKQRKAKGFVTSGVIGGVIGLIAAPPAAEIAAGGGLIGFLFMNIIDVKVLPLPARGQ